MPLIFFHTRLLHVSRFENSSLRSIFGLYFNFWFFCIQVMSQKLVAYIRTSHLPSSSRIFPSLEESWWVYAYLYEALLWLWGITTLLGCLQGPYFTRLRTRRLASSWQAVLKICSILWWSLLEFSILQHKNPFCLNSWKMIMMISGAY